MSHPAHALTLEGALAQASKGALVLDVRDSADFAAGHLAGSVQIGLGPKLGDFARAVLPRDATLVLVAPDGREQEAADALREAGFDRVAGYLEGGLMALAAHGELVEQLRRTDARRLDAALAGEDPPHVLDVRTAPEWEAGHLEGAQHLPLDALPGRLDEVPTDRDVVVLCRSGYRSTIAASLLRRHGHRRVLDGVGGMLAVLEGRGERRAE